MAMIMGVRTIYQLDPTRLKNAIIKDGRGYLLEGTGPLAIGMQQLGEDETITCTFTDKQAYRQLCANAGIQSWYTYSVMKEFENYRDECITVLKTHGNGGIQQIRT
jgi:hypothetical protein